MIRTNYHTHNDLCDGKGPVEDYIRAAVEKGFTALGFSSHAPLPVKNTWTLDDERLPVYIAEVEAAKIRWKDSIQIYTGLEVDYIPGSQGPGDRRWKDLKLDYIVGSVHSTDGLTSNPSYHCVDGPLDGLHWLLEKLYGGSFEALSSAYYERVKELVLMGGFAFLGHLDLIKKRNRGEGYFRESSPWYHKQVKGALDVLARSGIIMEINSGGISRGSTDEVYPSPWIISEARKRDIPVMVNADAHRPEDIDFHYDESLILLRDAGYRDIRVLLDGEWKAVPL